MECRDHMKRKNILFIMADQMAAPMLPFYGPSPIKLPNLSRLATQPLRAWAGEPEETPRARVMLFPGP
jgi:hypothetical protein